MHAMQNYIGGTSESNKFTSIFIVILRSTPKLRRSRKLENNKRDRQVDNKLGKHANEKCSEIDNSETFLK